MNMRWSRSEGALVKFIMGCVVSSNMWKANDEKCESAVQPWTPHQAITSEIMMKTTSEHRWLHHPRRATLRWNHHRLRGLPAMFINRIPLDLHQRAVRAENWGWDKCRITSALMQVRAGRDLHDDDGSWWMLRQILEAEVDLMTISSTVIGFSLASKLTSLVIFFTRRPRGGSLRITTTPRYFSIS